MDYDVVIVGLGPAGAILAAHLGSGLRVLALDKKGDADTGFRKPCGGLLAPDAQKALSRFDMTLPKDILVDPQIFSVKTLDLNTGLIRHYQRHYINMDRDKFDRWLISRIPPHVDVIKNALCKCIAKAGDAYEVTFAAGGRTHAARAKYVVGADGAGSMVRRIFYPDFKIRSYLSIQQWFCDTHPSPFYSCVFDSKITDAYCWALTKDDYFIFGGAFRKQSARRDFESVKDRLAGYGFRLGEPVKTEACLVLRPYGRQSSRTGEDNMFLIGEAAGFISPSSLEGISYAVESAHLLSECLNNPAADPNMAYRRKTIKLRTKIFIKTLKSPFMYNPLLRGMVMKSGLSAIKMAAEPEDSVDFTAKRLFRRS